jgi:hypothetical protein
VYSTGHQIYTKLHNFSLKEENALWSSGQNSWLQIPALPDFSEKKKTVVGLERGPFSLVSTIEELLERKVAASV